MPSATRAERARRPRAASATARRPQPAPRARRRAASRAPRVATDGAADGRASRRGAPPRRRRGPAGRIRAGAPSRVRWRLAGWRSSRWFLFSLFQPFKGDGDGRAVRVHDPAAARASARSRDLLEENDVISSAFFFQLRARLGGRSGDLKPGTLRAAQDMSYGAAIDALSRRAAAEHRRRSRFPRAARAARSRRSSSRPGSRATTCARARSSRRSTRADYEAGRRASLEGFLFPATYELKQGATVKRPRGQAARRVQAQLRQGRPAPTRSEEPDALRRADHRVDGRARGRGRQGAAADRLGDLQPAQDRHPARHRRDDPLRDRQLDRAAEAVRARADSPYNTRATRACRRGRSATRGSTSIKAAAHPARRTTCSTWSSRAATASTSSPRPTRSSSTTWTSTTASATGRAASRRPSC